MRRESESGRLYKLKQITGRSAVASGQVAQVRWDRLKDATAYAWFVTARSSGGGVTASQPAVFVTRDADGRPGRLSDSSPLSAWFDHR
ncbi:MULTISPECIES: hypothetical protein [unclassified Streptomyces]|uniref:hypothetical protein n=1 Tax=unclassified Streptomyces TaxID=2593676 RepID=UPI00340FFAB6